MNGLIPEYKIENNLLRKGVTSQLNRINERGVKLVEYKGELRKDYPEIVREALKTTLRTMVDNRLLDETTLKVVLDESRDTEALKSYLLGSMLYRKSDEELMDEFELIRNDFMNAFDVEIGFESKSVLNKDAVVMTKQFVLDAAFVAEYFMAEEKDVITLMKRKGFVEKFAVLRLSKVMEGFSAENPAEAAGVKQYASLAYYDATLDAYAIDLVLELDIDTLDAMIDYTELVSLVEKQDAEAERYYGKRMLA